MAEGVSGAIELYVNTKTRPYDESQFALHSSERSDVGKRVSAVQGVRGVQSA